MRKEWMIGCALLMAGFVSAQSRWQVTPEAGINMTKYKGEAPVVGFKAGAAVSYTFGEGRFALQSGVYYVRRGSGNNYSATILGSYINEYGGKQDFSTTVDEAYNRESMYYSAMNGGYGYGYEGSYGYGDSYSNELDFLPKNLTIDRMRYKCESSQMGYVQIPLLARFNWQTTTESKFHIAFGPYLAIGAGGRAHYEEVNRTTTIIDLPYHEKAEWNPFKMGYMGGIRTRLDWGISAEMGVDIRRFALKMGYDLGLGKDYKGDSFDISAKYHTASLSVGYSF